MKNYESRLEDILEKKDFSNETKNLLLSMLYKVEERYDDYKKVKVIVKEKEKFIDNILETIKNECNEIESKDEVAILEEILSKSEQCQFAINEIFRIGYILDASEVLRNFTGWSWNPDVGAGVPDDPIRPHNLIYQTIRILLGNEFVQNVQVGAYGYAQIKTRFIKFYGDLIGKLMYTKFMEVSLNLMYREKKMNYEKEMATIFSKCFKILIERVTEKKDIMRLIYELIYYESINKNDFTKIEDLLIEKGGENANNILRSNKDSNRIKLSN